MLTVIFQNSVIVHSGLSFCGAAERANPMKATQQLHAGTPYRELWGCTTTLMSHVGKLGEVNQPKASKILGFGVSTLHSGGREGNQDSFLVLIFVGVRKCGP